MHDPALRPHNLTRALFHMSGGVMALGAIEWLGTRPALITTAALIAAAAWSMEGMRRLSPRVNDALMWIFGPVAHHHEREKVNSATWYATAMLLIALSMPIVACEVAVVVLGFGDPVAALVGRRFGRHKLVAGRSVEGSVAFVGAATMAAFAALRVFHPEIGLGEAVALSLVGAFTGAVAEIFAKRVDDNFAIPLVSALGAAVVIAVS